MSQCPTCRSLFPDDLLSCPSDGSPLLRRRGAPDAATVKSDQLGAGVLSSVSPGALAAAGASPPSLALGYGATADLATAPLQPLILDEGSLQPGTMVGEYKITSRLGEGGMGTVYAGVHPLIGKRVAIKVLNAGVSSDPSIVQRFIQEARAVNQIGHRNIVDIFAFGQLPSGRCYFVMEHLPGGSLYARLVQTTTAPLSFEESFAILMSVCDALGAAHAEGIVHRDLKPENIFLAESKSGERTVKLLDFGIAKLLRSDGSDGMGGSLAQTRTGVPMGTPLYMSPEQCLGQKVDHRTDIYSVGVLMFEVFTGQLPFPGPSYIETVNGHISSPPPSASGLVEIPAELEELIGQCLEKDPALRPANTTVIRDRLRAIAAGIGIETGRRDSIPPLSATGQGPTPRRRSLPARAPGAQLSAPATANAQESETGKRRFATTAALVLCGAVFVAGASVGVASWVKTRRLAAAAAATIELQVGSDPTGAVVWIDGQAQALRTPNTFKLHRQSVYNVILRKDGYITYQESVTLADGQMQYAVAATLVPLKIPGGRLEVKTPARRATWIVDKKVAGDGTGVLLIDDLPPGRHLVAVDAQGFERREESIRVESGELASFEWALRPEAPEGDAPPLKGARSSSSPLSRRSRATPGKPAARAGAGAVDQDSTSGWPSR